MLYFVDESYRIICQLLETPSVSVPLIDIVGESERDVRRRVEGGRTTNEGPVELANTSRAIGGGCAFAPFELRKR